MTLDSKEFKGYQEGYKKGKTETIENIINLFKKDSIYTGAVIEFEIRSNLGAEEEKLI